MSEELDWGPARPPAVGWAGTLVILLGVAQAGAIGVALILDRTGLLAARTDRVVTGAVLGFLVLHVPVGIGVLRLWRWWRGIAMVVATLGIALQAANLAGPPDEPVVVGINAGLAVLYLIVLILLARSRAAFA